jgi:hypothetical protein
MPPKTPKSQLTKQPFKRSAAPHSYPGPPTNSFPSHYESRSILIAIGKQGRTFNVLEALLREKTSFFAYHGEPPVSTVKDGQGSNNTGTDIETPVDLDKETEIKPVHYRLTSEFHTLPAFETFVGWIYKTWPSVPETRSDCKSLLQTYVLAVQYNAISLQNAIIKCFCEHHRSVIVDLNHLVWMTDHTRDNIGLAMTAYLVQQIAYEMSDGGILQYEKYNRSLPTFMSKGDSLVRYELVKAIAHRAQRPGASDPAEDPSRWYVTEL